MEDLHVHVYAFLGVLELLLLLLIAVVVFMVRSNNLARRLSLVREKLKKVPQLPEFVSFEQYLREEVNRNQAAIERAVVSQDDTDSKAAELMKIREQYLELEVEARTLENDPEAFQDKLASGLNELIEQWRPEAEIVTETGVGVVEIMAQQEDATAEPQLSETRNLIDTHDAEFDRLKEVINNQQDVMEAMRKGEDELSRQDDRQELETKLEELEVLVESKDAIIEELENRYSELFLATTAENEPD